MIIQDPETCYDVEVWRVDLTGNVFLSILFEIMSFHLGVNTIAVSDRDIAVKTSRTQAGTQTLHSRGSLAWYSFTNDVGKKPTLMGSMTAWTKELESKYELSRYS